MIFAASLSFTQAYRGKFAKKCHDTPRKTGGWGARTTRESMR